MEAAGAPSRAAAPRCTAAAEDGEIKYRLEVESDWILLLLNGPPACRLPGSEKEARRPMNAEQTCG